jgi:hypothetical protein
MAGAGGWGRYSVTGLPPPTYDTELAGHPQALAVEMQGVALAVEGLARSPFNINACDLQVEVAVSLSSGSPAGRRKRVQVLDVVREATASISAPIVLFTYYNPIMARGLDKFCQQAKDAGAAGEAGRLPGVGWQDWAGREAGREACRQGPTETSCAGRHEQRGGGVFLKRPA